MVGLCKERPAGFLKSIFPYEPYIPYFSDQIDKTISDFEEGAFKKHNQDDPEFLQERLAILEEMKKNHR